MKCKSIVLFILITVLVSILFTACMVPYRATSTHDETVEGSSGPTPIEEGGTIIIEPPDDDD